MTRQEIEEATEREAEKVLLTPDALKRKLKHIAGLCYALCCDVSNMQSEIEELRAENEYLKAKTKKKPKFTRTPEDIERRRQSQLAHYARKRAEQAAASEQPPQDGAGAPNET